MAIRGSPASPRSHVVFLDPTIPRGRQPSPGSSTSPPDRQTQQRPSERTGSRASCGDNPVATWPASAASPSPVPDVTLRADMFRPPRVTSLLPGGGDAEVGGGVLSAVGLSGQPSGEGPGVGAHRLGGRTAARPCVMRWASVLAASRSRSGGTTRLTHPSCSARSAVQELRIHALPLRPPSVPRA
jgi:hypothetical protein